MVIKATEIRDTKNLVQKIATEPTEGIVRQIEVIRHPTERISIKPTLPIMPEYFIKENFPIHYY